MVKLKPASHFKPLTSEEFFEAISRGDSSAAAEVLRSLDGLSRADLQILADLLAGDAALASLFPYRIRLSKRKGKVDHLRKWADIFAIVRSVEHAEKSFGKREAAVEEVIKQSKGKLSRAKIFRALAAEKKTKKPESH